MNPGDYCRECRTRHASWAYSHPAHRADRDAEIKRRRHAGATLGQLALASGLTRQRISQIVKEGQA